MARADVLLDKRPDYTALIIHSVRDIADALRSPYRGGYTTGSDMVYRIYAPDRTFRFTYDRHAGEEPISPVSVVVTPGFDSREIARFQDIKGLKADGSGAALTFEATQQESDPKHDSVVSGLPVTVVLTSRSMSIQRKLASQP